METKKILASKNVILTSVIATVLLVAAVGSASAVTPINNCNFNANAAGEYELGQNLNCGVGVPGITIGANNVVINCYNGTNGAAYWINGSVGAVADCSQGGTFDETHPVTDNCGIVDTAGWDNVVIKNCEIKNFCTGIAIGTAGWGVYEENVSVIDCLIYDCGNAANSPTHGIHMVGPNNCTIKKNTIYNIDGSGAGCGAGGNGIYLRGNRDQADGLPYSGEYNNITCNNLSDNRKSGFFAKYMCMYNNVSYNYAVENGEGGIVPMCKKSDYNTYEYNNMSDNIAWGFYTRGRNNTIRYNTIMSNGQEGINIGTGVMMGVDHGVYNIVTNNTACSNTGNDISITQDWRGYTNTVDENTCNNGNNASYCNDWKCNSLTHIYYDWDGDQGDGDCCSDDPADWTCNNTLGVGACNNPGLFNSSAWYDHCLYDYTHDQVHGCNTTGNDFNDCDASRKGDPPVAPVPELATILLFGAGLITLVGYVELKKRRKG